jgi:flagellar basal-body rod modification protein FlgD
MKKATGLNKDDFLNLFIAQMKNQDPLNPMDGTEFISQLAQLTQVEQAYNTNTNLQNLINAQNGSNSLASVAFIGNTITAKGAETNLIYGGQTAVGFKLPSQAESVQINIFNSQGNVVRSINRGPSSAGISTVPWDGKDNSGQLVPSGRYRFTVTASGANGSAIVADPLIAGKVDGVSIDGTTPMLSVGGVEVPLTDVISVKGA